MTIGSFSRNCSRTALRRSRSSPRSELDLPRDVSRSPLFDVMLTMQSYRAGGVDPPAGLSVTDFPLNTWATRYDLELYVADVPGGGLAGAFVYNTDLFEWATIRQFAGHLRTLLERVAARPWLRLSQIDLLTSDERQLLIEGRNGTAIDYPGTATLHGEIEVQASTSSTARGCCRSTPGAISAPC